MASGNKLIRKQPVQTDALWSNDRSNDQEHDYDSNKYRLDDTIVRNYSRLSTFEYSFCQVFTPH